MTMQSNPPSFQVQPEQLQQALDLLDQLYECIAEIYQDEIAHLAAVEDIERLLGAQSDTDPPPFDHELPF